MGYTFLIKSVSRRDHLLLFPWISAASGGRFNRLPKTLPKILRNPFPKALGFNGNFGILNFEIERWSEKVKCRKLSKEFDGIKIFWKFWAGFWENQKNWKIPFLTKWAITLFKQKVFWQFLAWDCTRSRTITTQNFGWISLAENSLEQKLSKTVLAHCALWVRDRPISIKLERADH